MGGAAGDALALVLLLGALTFAVVRPRGYSEAVVAVPAAVLTVAAGVLPCPDAVATLREIAPTVGFLAAILLFGHLCADAGIFAYLGEFTATAARGSAPRLLALVVLVAALVTVALTLDATVVLLTPVVLATVAAAGVTGRPFAYACVRIANSGSLLLPVSNLTNLLAFPATGLTFGRFAALMALPWVVVCGVEWLTLRCFFRRDLVAPAGVPERTRPPPRYPLVVVLLSVGLVVGATYAAIAPAWPVLLGCLALAAPRRRELSARRLVAEAHLGFCVFVLALAVVVAGVTGGGFGRVLHALLPGGSSWAALVGLTVLAAVLANVVNNLPATLALMPLLAGQPAALLAVLIGVNVGPNLAYPGSLATLLWRRRLPDADKPRAAEFHRFGALTVPLLLVAASTALWAAEHIIGVGG